MHASTDWYVCWVVPLSLLVADGCPSVVDSSCSKDSTIVWPETEIGETVTVSCPCGSPRSSLLPALKATRSCGGNYNNGAQWEDAFCRDCQFHDSRLMLCTLSQVSTTWINWSMIFCSGFKHVHLSTTTDWQSFTISQIVGYGHSRCKHLLQWWCTTHSCTPWFHHCISVRYKHGAG